MSQELRKRNSNGVIQNVHGSAADVTDMELSQSPVAEKCDPFSVCFKKKKRNSLAKTPSTVTMAIPTPSPLIESSSKAKKAQDPELAKLMKDLRDKLVASGQVCNQHKRSHDLGSKLKFLSNN